MIVHVLGHAEVEPGSTPSTLDEWTDEERDGWMDGTWKEVKKELPC